MPEARYRLTPAARNDLAEIWRFGADHWSAEQADRYLDGLFAVFDLLADFPLLARERSEFTPSVRIHPVDRHLVVYRRTEQTEILRILHDRQDLLAALGD